MLRPAGVDDHRVPVRSPGDTALPDGAYSHIPKDDSQRIATSCLSLSTYDSELAISYYLRRRLIDHDSAVQKNLVDYTDSGREFSPKLMYFGQ